jgi:hypothetical protein
MSRATSTTLSFFFVKRVRFQLANRYLRYGDARLSKRWVDGSMNEKPDPFLPGRKGPPFILTRGLITSPFRNLPRFPEFESRTPWPLRNLKKHSERNNGQNDVLLSQFRRIQTLTLTILGRISVARGGSFGLRFQRLLLQFKVYINDYLKAIRTRKIPFHGTKQSPQNGKYAITTQIST